MNPFAEKYKTLSVAQLLEITDTPENYQPAAVTAAEDELLARNLTLAEMTEARAENELAANERAARSDRKRAVEHRLMNAAAAVIDTISPVQKTPASEHKVILLISIVFALFGLYHFYNCFEIIRLAIVYGYHKVFLSAALPGLFEGIFLCGAAWMFWKRMKWGWILLAVYLFFAPFGALFALIAAFFRNMTLFGDGMQLWREYAQSALFGVLFFGVCIWFLYRRSIRRLYGIDKISGILTASAGVLLALLAFALIAARAY